VGTLVFGHKNRLQVDMGDLQNEKENLASFLQSNLKISVAQGQNKLTIDSEKLTVLELHQAVTKYIHRHNLSRIHYASIQDKTVKINRFEGFKKKKEKQKSKGASQSITQSWGL
jgi:hypothetical protein